MHVDLLTIGLVSRLDEANVAAGGRLGGPLKGARGLHSTRPVNFMSVARSGWNRQQRGSRHLKDGDSALEMIIYYNSWRTGLLLSSVSNRQRIPCSYFVFAHRILMFYSKFRVPAAAVVSHRCCLCAFVPFGVQSVTVRFCVYVVSCVFCHICVWGWHWKGGGPFINVFRLWSENISVHDVAKEILIEQRGVGGCFWVKALDILSSLNTPLGVSANVKVTSGCGQTA